MQLIADEFEARNVQENVLCELLVDRGVSNQSRSGRMNDVHRVASNHRTSDASPTTRNSLTNDLGPDDESSLFSREELSEFAADDAAAGRSIGKILSALFIYTLIAMSVATWWTFRTVGH